MNHPANRNELLKAIDSMNAEKWVTVGAGIKNKYVTKYNSMSNKIRCSIVDDNVDSY